MNLLSDHLAKISSLPCRVALVLDATWRFELVASQGRHIGRDRHVAGRFHPPDPGFRPVPVAGAAAWPAAVPGPRGRPAAVRRSRQRYSAGPVPRRSLARGRRPSRSRAGSGHLPARTSWYLPRSCSLASGTSASRTEAGHQAMPHGTPNLRRQQGDAPRTRKP
jgi:hypothetical protein